MSDDPATLADRLESAATFAQNVTNGLGADVISDMRATVAYLRSIPGLTADRDRLQDELDHVHLKLDGFLSQVSPNPLSVPPSRQCAWCHGTGDSNPNRPQGLIGWSPCSSCGGSGLANPEGATI